MRVRAGDTTALALGSVLNGLLAYAFFAIATRYLGPGPAAAVSVLWTYWSFAAATFTFPLQHWIARTVAAEGDEGSVARSMPGVVAAVLTASVVAGALAWVAREPLFHRDDAWFPVLVGWVTIGSAFMGVVRGGLAARHRFGWMATVLASENAVRSAAALVLVLVGLQANVGLGICLVLGSFVGLVLPWSFRFSRDRARLRQDSHRSPLSFLGGAAGGQLLGQTVLTGGPVLLALTGGSPAEVTALFVGLALFRVPYTLALGLVSQVTGRLTTLVVQGRRRAWQRVRVSVLGGAAVTALLAAGIGYLIGPELIHLVFGAEVDLSRPLCVVLAVGSALALANLVLTIALIAQGHSWWVALSWLVALAGAAVVFGFSSAAPLERASAVFLGAEAVAFAALLLAELRGAARTPSLVAA